MNLDHHLALRTPLLWIKTEEQGRIIDTIVKNTNRAVFMFDTLKGLIVWDHNRKQWVNAIVVDPITQEEGPTKDKSVAINHIIEEKGIFIVANAHNAVENMVDFLLSLLLQFRDSFHQDNLDLIPAQFIFLSHKGEVPGEISRFTTILEHGLPDEKELKSILTHVKTKVPVSSEEGKIIRAGLGLSETEFISAILRSAREQGGIESQFVHTEKMDVLKKGNILNIREPRFTMADLGGLDKAKSLIQKIGLLWSNEELGQKLKLDPLHRLLLVGVPGTGKSLICEVISSALGLDLAEGGVSKAMNKFVGESEQNMQRMFDALNLLAPVVFWVDEFGRDMSGGQSSARSDSGTTDRVHGIFLTGLQELRKNIFLTAAANRIDDLPPEMLRADRFDKVMFVGLPTEQERTDIFRIHLSETSDEYDFARLAASTATFTGAEIKQLCRTVKFNVGTRDRRLPTDEEFLEAIPHAKGRVWTNHGDQILQMYYRAKREWEWASTAQEQEANDVISALENKKSTSVPRYTPKSTGANSGVSMQWPPK